MQVKQISDNEIYVLIKYTKSVLWRVAKCLSYIEEARCLKVNAIKICLSTATWHDFNTALRPALRFVKHKSFISLRFQSTRGRHSNDSHLTNKSQNRYINDERYGAWDPPYLPKSMETQVQMNSETNMENNRWITHDLRC